MLTPEQEKFVVDLFLINQKQQQLNAFSEQRELDEKALATQYQINEANKARASLVDKFNSDTAPLRQEINDIKKNLAK